MKAYGKWMYRSNFLDLAVFGGEWSTSRPSSFTPWERATGIHWEIRAGLDDLEKRKFLTLTGLAIPTTLFRLLGRSYKLYNLLGVSPLANYTDRAIAAGQRS
jgi:hypothetical protein